MTNTELTQSFVQTILKTQASFRQAIQHSLKQNKAGITFEMMQIMACLWRKENVNQQELADKTFKDKASLTYLINNLEKRGLVIRLSDPADRRNKLIGLTPQGEELRLKIMPLLQDIYAEAGRKINKEHLHISIKYLQEMSDVFREV